MKFRIGSTTYSLRITEGPLTCDGATCRSATLQSPREILIAGDTPPQDRAFVLMREIARAWTFETGVPRSKAGWLDLAATAARGAIIDLNFHGGELALMAMRPGETHSYGTAKIGLTQNRQCGTCQGTIAGGSIVCRPAPCDLLELAAYCEFCGTTMRWQEPQTARGMPSGVVLGEPTFERGDTRGTTSHPRRGCA